MTTKFVYDEELVEARITRRVRLIVEENRRREESRRQNPWNKLARVILQHHADTLTKRDHGFVTTLANRAPQPGKGDLAHLKAIADRLGIEA